MRCKCADCPTHACYTKGVNCTGISHEEVKNFYTDEEKKIMQAAAYVEGTFYSNICRLQETAEFAKAMGYKKLACHSVLVLTLKLTTLPNTLPNKVLNFTVFAARPAAYPRKIWG